MNEQLLQQLKSTNPELYQAMLEETSKLQQAERELQKKLEELEEQKKNISVSSKPRKLFSQRGFSPIMWERFGILLIQVLENALVSFCIENLQQEDFKGLSESEQFLYAKRLLNYLTKHIKTPDKIKTKSNKSTGEAVSLFD